MGWDKNKRHWDSLVNCGSIHAAHFAKVLTYLKKPLFFHTFRYVFSGVTSFKQNILTIKSAAALEWPAILFGLIHKIKARSACITRLRWSFWIVTILATYFGLFVAGASPVIQIIGQGKIELTNEYTSKVESFEEATLIIKVKDNSYNIVYDGIKGEIGRVEVGSDGMDSFMVDGRIGPWNRNGKGESVYATPGRCPQDCSALIQAAWIAYCSKNYFNEPSHITGLPLARSALSLTHAELVTNYVKEWNDLGTPKVVEAIAGNIVYFTGEPDPYILGQYPKGYLAWDFFTDDSLKVDSYTIPQRVLLTGYLPKTELTNIMTPDVVRAVRRISFRVSSVQITNETFNPLPRLKTMVNIIDTRFPIAGKFLVLSEADPTNGWPVRTEISNPSVGYKKAETAAKRIALDNGLVRQERSKKSTVAIIIIFMTNCAVFLIVISKINRNKQLTVNT